MDVKYFLLFLSRYRFHLGPYSSLSLNLLFLWILHCFLFFLNDNFIVLELIYLIDFLLGRKHFIKALECVDFAEPLI